MGTAPAAPTRFAVSRLSWLAAPKWLFDGERHIWADARDQAHPPSVRQLPLEFYLKTAEEKVDELMRIKPQPFDGRRFGDDLVDALGRPELLAFVFGNHPSRDRVEIRSARRFEPSSPEAVSVGGFAPLESGEVCRLALDVKFDEQRLVGHRHAAWVRSFASREREDAPAEGDRTANFVLQNWSHEELLAVCRRWSIGAIYARAQGEWQTELAFRGFQVLQGGNSMYLDLSDRHRLVQNYEGIRTIYRAFAMADVWDRPVR
jgi:hypothetical protein